MAEVFLTGELRRLAGGVAALHIEAADVRALFAELERRIPGFEEQLEAGLAVAIDGEIFPDAAFEVLGPDSEVHFLPAVRGG